MMQDMTRSVVMILGFALFFAFAVLAVQFNSLKLPALVLSVIPFCLAGTVAALFLTGIPHGRHADHRHPGRHRPDGQSGRPAHHLRRIAEIRRETDDGGGHRHGGKNPPAASFSCSRSVLLPGSSPWPSTSRRAGTCFSPWPSAPSEGWWWA
ncbi:MAG: efflux RND transporter permease subunit [Desulfobacterales bacterium]|nr:efflux RND transporter permease subunit [Desulfobacterales bacterium]